MASLLSQQIDQLQSIMAAAATGNLEAVYQESMNVLKNTLGAEVGSLQLVNHETQKLEYVATILPEELFKLQKEVGSLPINEGSISGSVAKSGKPLLLKDSWTHPKFGERQKSIAQKEEVSNRSYICVPLKARGKVIGILNILHGEPDMFDENHKSLTISLASFIALAVAPTQLVERLKQIAAAILTLDRKDVYQESMRALHLTLGVEVSGSLQLIDRDRENLEFVATLIPEDLAKLQAYGPIPVDDKDIESVSGHVFKHGKPLLLHDSHNDPKFGERQRAIAEKDKVGNRSYICVPVLIENQVFGILNVLHAKPNIFSEEDSSLASFVASLIAIAIHKAEQAEQKIQTNYAIALALIANKFIHDINNNVILVGVKVRQLKRKKRKNQLSEEYLWSQLSSIEEISDETVEEIDRFKSFDRIQERDLIEVPKCIEKALHTLERVLIDVDVNVDLSDESAPPLVYATPQLTDIFVNLIRNSAQAMQKSPEKKISIVWKQVSPDYLNVSIIDTGPGVPAHIQNQLFLPGTTTKQRGGGHGLWWNQTWLSRTGGSIRYDRNYKEGARFVIDLPLRDHIKSVLARKVR